MKIYDYNIATPDGKKIALKDYKGKVIMLVNTATECGFTPQYQDLVKLDQDYKEQGLVIIDIPCNQFAGQAPGSDAEIHEFCAVNFGTKFLRGKKADVNGENALPIYNYLKEQQGFVGFGDGKFADLLDEMLSKADPNYSKNPDIKWNFTKFIVDRDGKVVKRFEPTVDMAEVAKFIEGLL